MDRNLTPHQRNTKPIPSLSARRAWIEMGVDFAEDWLNASLSARRAWIEIKMLLRDSTGRSGRSPQGERG